ncbi:monovalent cation/H(+) antiporter subunit G [Corynebacterium choanae]|uniref:Na(+)/H(+) antiporter subunit G n=1 Tax=Corynebacterium choanae TaxID=1862358 RepID=A0A3G6J8E3_9CORY|nr:monovalent cation/H(+) antiporter subunit G [Corynebacterium choanae]AZA12720.1 Na(+)/H(+) antiporter subunit G [Corynebacterium choanae]
MTTPTYLVVADVISAGCVLLGAVLALTASIGLVRFPDTLSRMHAVAKPQTLGLIVTVAGAIIRIATHPQATAAEHGDIGIIVLTVVFSLITAPVIAQRVGRKAAQEGLYAKGHVTVADGRDSSTPSPTGHGTQ